MKNSSRRIGVYGGTFDPIHKGHLAIAKQAKNQLGLDFVYFIPAYIPPHKQQHSPAAAQHRLRMMMLAVKGKKEFKISTIELKRRGISYTVDTLRYFKRQFPKSELFLIIGADNLVQFNSWKSPKTILQLASLAVYKRKGFNLPLKKAPNRITLKGKMLRISSTEIRKINEMGLEIRDLVPKLIEHYIKQHSLYLMPAHAPHKRQFHEIHCID
jgi:nicotinate-nucleotide adenylyltransferase